LNSDVPGSPKLSRLLAALEIESPAANDMDLISPTPAIAPAQETHGYISLSALHNTNHNVHNDDITELVKRPYNNKCNHKAGFNSLDLFFPSGEWMTPSPYNEVYLFPPLAQHRPTKTPTLEYSITAQRERANRLNAFLNASEGFGSKIIFRAMEDLASAYFELGDYVSSEAWWRRIIDLREHADGAGSVKVISDTIELMKVMRWRSSSDDNFIELETRTHRMVQQNLPPNHELAIEFSSNKAARLISTPQRPESERILREILQIALMHLGPKDSRTITIIGLLAFCTASIYVVSASERHPDTIVSFPPEAMVHLARTAMQLHTESRDIMDRNGQRAANDLLYVLRTTERYEEGLTLAELMVKRSSMVLGESHPRTLRYQAELGALCSQQGRFMESVTNLQAVLRLQNPDTAMQDNVWRMEELATALLGLQRYQEASVWLEKVFPGQIPIYGLLDRETKTSCQRLGYCYMQTGRYQDALDLYQNYKARIRNEGDGDRSSTTEVDGWLQDLKVKWPVKL
jgi:hypothetical protein